MRKDSLAWLLILFAALSTPLSVEYTSAQGSKELRELTNPLKNNNKDIENLRLGFTNLETKIELLQKENIETKAVLKKAEDILIEAEAKLNLGKQALEVSENNLSLPRTLITLAGVFVGLFIALGAYALSNMTTKKVDMAEKAFTLRVDNTEKILTSKVDNAEKVLQSKIDMAEKELTSKIEELQKELRLQVKQNTETIENKIKELSDLAITNYWAIGVIYCSYSTVNYEANNIDQAIVYGEEGLEHLEKGKFSRKENVELTIAGAKANLAYYYAYASKTNKKAISLKYVEDGLQIFRKEGYIDWIDCFLFVYSKFATDIEDKKTWLSIYKSYKEQILDLNRSGIIKDDVITSYEKFYTNIQDIVNN